MEVGTEAGSAWGGVEGTLGVGQELCQVLGAGACVGMLKKGCVKAELLLA